MKKKYKLYNRFRRFETNIILKREEKIKDNITGKPETKSIAENKMRAVILNQKSGYGLNSMIFQNERQNTDEKFDIYFKETVEIEPKLKDKIIWNNKEYQINKLEDNRIDSDFWKGEIVGLS